MNIKYLLVGCLLPLSLFTGCKKPQTEQNQKHSAPHEDNSKILFEDSMMKNWQEQWFLDGKQATLEHRPEGLYFSGGTVTKAMDPEAYHAHHAVLWTKQIFEGDLRISYEMTRRDSSDYGTTLLYIQAQGIGTATYPEDISAWNERREIPAMSEYFENMNLISLSFRENLRCKRYPWKNPKGEWYPQRGLIDPKVEYPGIIPGKTYRVEVEKRDTSVTLRLFEADKGEKLIEHHWNTTKIPSEQKPVTVTKGRIGLRHMATKQMIYQNFKVERL